MGQLPDTEEDIERAERNVSDLLCRGLVSA
jgi:hypothetical protein